MLPFLKAPIRRLKRLARKSSKWPIGYAIIAGVLVTRSLGLLASLELQTLDFLLRNRLPDAPDDEVVIILFERSTVLNQDDHEELTEQRIAQLLKIVFSADPAAVGLNIFLDDTSDAPGREQLVNLFETHPNLIGVQKALPPRKIDPPTDMPEAIVAEQFGVNDVPLDQDGRVRRTFLGFYLEDGDDRPENNPFRFSFSFKLAAAYLSSQGYRLDNHPRRPDVPVFQSENARSFTPIPIITSESGGYHQETNISDIQSLLNFRSGTNAFQIIDAFDFFSRSIDPRFLRDKIVIVGQTDSDFPRFLPVAASSSLIQGEVEEDAIIPRIGIVGSELEAHSASQLIDAVIDGRPLLRTLPTSVEILLIFGAGLTGSIVATSLSSTKKSALTLVIFITINSTLSYLAITMVGLWLPIVPMTLCCFFAGVTPLNYRTQRIALHSQEKLLENQEKFLESQEKFLESQQLALTKAGIIESERRKATERAFSAIHAGPLQRLAALLRITRDGNINQSHIIKELESLNKEIRGVGERLRQEAIGDIYFFYSEGNIKLDLTHPMHEVLYEVYSLAVQRRLPGFENVKVRAISIEPFDCSQLSLDIKRDLCWFLEESLQNIGKHALGTTRIQVSGKYIDEFYVLKIEDNGPGMRSIHIGDGTQSFYRLEAILRGKFARYSKPKGGTVCELYWPTTVRPISV